MDQERVGELYRRYGPAVFSRCRRLLKEPAAAEDAAQEVFVRVLRYVDGAPGDEAALAWIYRTATNYCLNQLRDRASQAKPTEVLPDRPGVDWEAALADRDALLKILGSAPEKLRAPAVLYWADGLDQSEIARVLGVSRRTVLYRLAELGEHARRVLRGGGA